jgi:mannose-1-phosphate guanylyltransferase/phosphomannomutase
MVDDCRRSLPSESRDSIAGIVLAGTYQWTGSPFDEIRPRPLLPVALRPLIDYVIDWLDTAGVATTTICANGSTDAIRRHLESRVASRVKLDYYADHSPRGAAGCIKDAAATKAAQTFIVSDGTSIPHVDVAALVAHHRRTGAAITMVVHPSDGKFTGQKQFEPTGTYVFDRSVLDLVPATSFSDIKENLIPSAHRHGCPIELFETAGASPRVLNAASYVAANRWVAERMATTANAASREEEQNSSPQLDAHSSAWIHESATIIGPVVLGRGARIHAGAVLVGPTIIGADSVIGAGAVVSRSVTWDGCVVGTNAVVDQCLLTDGAVVEPGESLSTVLRPKAHSHRSLLQRLAQKLDLAQPATPLAKHALSFGQSASSTRQ